MTIEEIDLGCEELEAISNSKWQAIPIVYFQKDGKAMNFNRPAEKLVNFERFTISFNSTYIVFTPSDGKSGYTYRITPRCGAGTASASSTNLTNRIPNVKGKHFKLYKSGNRFCFIHEPDQQDTKCKRQALQAVQERQPLLLHPRT